MTDRLALVEKYKQRQKDVAASQEKTKAQILIREESKKEFEKTEKFLKNLDTIAQLVGEVLQKLTDEKIMVKLASGPRYVVGVRPKIDKNKLKPGVRVTLD
jgi:26S proteasome regulatory subunit T4